AVVLEIPRPVHEKFRGPAQPRPPAMQLRWQLLSFGYFDRLSYVYQILQNARTTTPFVSENEINFPQIFEGITARYTCGASQLKEEFAISQLAREALPDPAQFQLSAEHTYLVFAAEFSIFPGNVNALAHTSGGRKPIKTGNRFAYDGEGRLDFEYDAEDLYCFFPPDFAWAVNNEEDRIPVRRIVYSERGKNYLLIGVPWRWVREAAPGPLIIDPTTNLTASDDTYLYGANNINNSQLFVGKYQCTDKKRALVRFNVCGVGIPTNATILNAQMKLWYYAAEAGTPCGGSQVPTNGWVQAHRMLVPWHEAQATRDVRLTSVNWTTPYAAINGTDALATMESTVKVKQNETGTWKSWTLTNAVQYAGGSQ
ncbi:DNRLRE domain-containing protein, partial [candidate division KSB1 bacterium]|nr:DNRLRE domain-containing protein [candidate division KSB1 bacterium]